MMGTEGEECCVDAIDGQATDDVESGNGLKREVLGPDIPCTGDPDVDKSDPHPLPRIKSTAGQPL